MTQLRALWEKLRASLWFIPTLIVLGAVMLAVGLVELDATLDVANLAHAWPRLLGAGVDGARSMLVAIASSMITVAGVTFSITIVVLALASSQYTSRILRNFMRDRANQTVLGVFVGVFAYCLIVLRSIRGGDEGIFVPSVAVLMAVVLAFVAIGFFVFFIHHISASIQAANILASISSETLQAIDRLYPAGNDPAPQDSAASPGRELVWIPIPATRTGYIQGIDAEVLCKLAQEHQLTLRMEKAIGGFVIESTALISVAATTYVEETVVCKLEAAYTIDRERTLHQDAAFGIRQIVDVALKALSPGINDTTTAVNCVDYLGAIMAKLVTRRIETPIGFDGPWLINSCGPTFDSLLSEAFDQIRHNAEGNTAVLVRMLHSLQTAAERTSAPARRHALRQQVGLIAETAERSIASAYDRMRMATAEKQILSLLSA